MGKGMKRPNGVAIKDGDLYLAEISRILLYKNIDKQVDIALQKNDSNYLLSNLKPTVFAEGFPTDDQHGW